MAITNSTHDPALLPRFYGLSTDTKPTGNPVGSTFGETDTGKDFLYSGTEWIRLGLTTVEQAEAVVVEQVQTTDEILAEMLVQLKIQNEHLSLASDVPTDDMIPAGG